MDLPNKPTNNPHPEEHRHSRSKNGVASLACGDALQDEGQGLNEKQ
jgi:hypothetical protein